jgi:DNA repair protein RadC
MPINNWPVGERPREKLLVRGARELSDAELLAIIIGSDRKGRSAIDVGRDLLSRFDGLRELFEADQRELCAIPGLGEAGLGWRVRPLLR